MPKPSLRIDYDLWQQFNMNCKYNICNKIFKICVIKTIVYSGLMIEGNGCIYRIDYGIMWICLYFSPSMDWKTIWVEYKDMLEILYSN